MRGDRCLILRFRRSGLWVVRGDLKAIYSAATESEAEFNLELFAEKWDKQYPSISKSWRNHWQHIIPFFAFPRGYLPHFRLLIFQEMTMLLWF